MVINLEEEQHKQITYDCLSYYKPVKLLEEILKTLEWSTYRAYIILA